MPSHTYLPPGGKAIGCRWIYKVKYKNGAAEVSSSEWKLDCYKARLTAKGYSQKPGIDFAETFAPVVRPDVLRVLLAFSPENFNVVVHS